MQVYLRDLRAGTTRWVSERAAGGQADADSVQPAVSGDGRLVAWTSLATDLVAGDTNGETDVFMRDPRAGRTTLVSVARDGRRSDGQNGGPAVSADGRSIAWTTFATTLVPGDTNSAFDVVVRDLRTGVIRRASHGPGGRQAAGGGMYPSISADGRTLAFQSEGPGLVPQDTPQWPDVFVRGPFPR